MQTGHRGPDRYSFSSQESHDAATYTRSLSAWNGEIQQVDCTTFQGRVTELWLGPMQILHERVDQPFAYRGTVLRPSLNLISVLPSKAVLSSGIRRAPLRYLS